MSKLPSWVLVGALFVAGCGPVTTGWTDWEGGAGAAPVTGGSSGGGTSEAGSEGGGSPSASSSGSSGAGSSGVGGGSSGGAVGAGDGGVTATCTSGVISHTNEGSSMKPGDTCVACHSSGNSEANPLTIGGTVYPTAHESTDCDGVSVSGATVVITDANKNVVTLAVNSVGNFYTSAPVATPYTASVSYNGQTLAMATPQTSGDCNSCHDVAGANGAPGRVMLP